MRPTSLEIIYQNIIEGLVPTVVRGVREALETGYEPLVIINQALIPAMEEVSRRFENQTCFVPETLVATRAMKEGMKVLHPHLRPGDVSSRGRLVLGTVEGDIHDIGKNIVGMLFEGAGFEVIDLGAEVQAQQFVAAVKQYQPDLVGLSTLLTTTMLHMPRTIKALREAGLRDQVKVLVGGAPVTQQFADQIGADLYAPNAGAAVQRVLALVFPG